MHTPHCKQVNTAFPLSAMLSRWYRSPLFVPLPPSSFLSAYPSAHLTSRRVVTIALQQLCSVVRRLQQPAARFQSSPLLRALVLLCRVVRQSPPHPPLPLSKRRGAAKGLKCNLFLLVVCGGGGRYSPPPNHPLMHATNKNKLHFNPFAAPRPFSWVRGRVLAFSVSGTENRTGARGWRRRRQPRRAATAPSARSPGASPQPNMIRRGRG